MRTPLPKEPDAWPSAMRSAGLALTLAFWAGLPSVGWAAVPTDIEAMRSQALAFVNRAREEEGLEELDLGEDLTEAAQAHASDMLARGYYAHEAPEGDTVQDRYLDAGGSQWELVAENIARCTSCEPPVADARIEELHEGWMASPRHRDNILAPGLSRFGFGIATGEDGRLYAVQTFAGPGIPRGLQPEEEAVPLDAEEQLARAIQGLNRARQRAGVPPVEPSEPLSQVAQGLLPAEQEEFALAAADDLFEALPQEERGAWSSLSVVAGACGGCGTEPVAADIRDFRARWLDDPGYRGTLLDTESTHAGFALAANGEGRKVAILVVAQRR